MYYHNDYWLTNCVGGIVGFRLKTELDVLIRLAVTFSPLRFVLKLKTSVDASAPPSEKDFVALW